MTLPDILARYIDAANRFQIDSASGCFTADAIVQDEKRKHIGREAVRAWLEDTTQRYRPRVEVSSAEVDGENVCLKAIVSGNFPGSPIELEYNVMLRDGKICRLAIQ
jgi:hypothetical protein